MRVAVISTPVFQLPLGGYGGLEAIAWHSAKGLAEKGHEVFLIAPEGSTCPGVTIIPNGKAGTWDESAAYSTYWQHLLGMDVCLDHSIAGDERLLVKIDGKCRWITFEQLYAWAEERSPVMLDGNSAEVPVRGLEVPSAVDEHAIRWRQVGAVIRHKRKDPLLKICTTEGHHVHATSGHSMIVADGKGIGSVRADESVGRYAVTAKRIPAAKLDMQFWPVGKSDVEETLSGWRSKHGSAELSWPLKLTDEDLVLFGMWIGDGCYDRKAGVLLASGEKTCRIGRKVAKRFDAKVKLSKAHRVKWRINSTLLVALMKAVGFDGYSDTKKVPDWVFDLSRRQIGLFLKGYFSADGHAGKYRACVCSVNENLIRQTSVLLSMCGIRSKISVQTKVRNPFNAEGNVSPVWELGVTQSEWEGFLKWVGFVQEERNEKLRANLLKRRSWRGDVPYSLVRERIVATGKESLISLSKLARKKGEETAEKFAGSPIAWREIVSSEDTGRTDEYVYDLSVPGTENFFVGQVCCHNSWLKWSYWLKMEGRLKAPVLGVMHAPVNTMYKELPQIDKPCFVCISEDQANHFRALYGRDCRRCYNGIDLDHYKPIQVPKSHRYLFLARFSTIKGPDLAVSACKSANQGLDLVGDTSITNEPEYFQQIKAECDKSQGLFRMVGPASRGECVWWYSQAKALLHPTKLFREPYGLAPVEAQACGLPVVAWKYGACQETVKHGETGFLVSSLEEMVEIIQWDAVRSIKPERCREWASQFSVQRMVDTYDRLIKEAVEGGW